MRWRAFYYFNQRNCDNIFGFKSKSLVLNRRNVHHLVLTLFHLEKILAELLTSLKFRHVKDLFPIKLNEDIRKMQNSPNVFFFFFYWQNK